MQHTIPSSCKAIYITKHTRKSLSPKFSFKFTLVISLILLSTLTTLISAVPTPLSSSLSSKKRNVSEQDLARFVNFASAAYCKSSTFPKWNCGPNCDATNGTVVKKFFTTQKTNTQAFIAVDDANELIIVAYRGTVTGNLKNIITDARIVLVNYPPAKNAKVHVGFYDAFLDAHSQVLDEVKKLHKENPNYKVLYTGHSLGGALTLLSALDLVQNTKDFTPNENLFVVTYGQPRVGNSAFADYVDSKLKLRRVVNGGDLVARLPPRVIGYEHSSTQLWIDDPKKSSNEFITCKGDEDQNCSDSLSVTELNVSFHDGPYFGTTVGCDSPNIADFDDLASGLGQDVKNNNF